VPDYFRTPILIDAGGGKINSELPQKNEPFSYRR
jgi:hypothetical protein